MHRLILVVAVLAVLLVPAVASASGQPTRTKVPDSAFTGTAPAGAVCPFELSEALVVNNAYSLTFPADANGDVRQISSGTAIVRLTNDATGASLVANISGPEVTVFHADGSQTITSGGSTALPNLILPAPSAVIVDGRTVTNVSPSGQVTLLSFNGTIKLDVCAALA